MHAEESPAAQIPRDLGVTPDELRETIKTAITKPLAARDKQRRNDQPPRRTGPAQPSRPTQDSALVPPTPTPRRPKPCGAPWAREAIRRLTSKPSTRGSQPQPHIRVPAPRPALSHPKLSATASG
ncbi:hypothetical protein AB0D33_26890 [Streptomyces sp. NPDC048404]|uniref:hypothetical protein n=1 Tax=unclassified Streptomyces TaxID=2593676 RepID=UPI00343FC14A